MIRFSSQCLGLLQKNKILDAVRLDTIPKQDPGNEGKVRAFKKEKREEKGTFRNERRVLGG